MENVILPFLKFFQVINIVVVILVLLAGLFAKNYLSEWQFFYRWKVSAAMKTLLVASLFILVYALTQWFAGSLSKADISSYFLSYALATSLYELLLKRFFSWLKLQPDDKKK
jgi:hypothetical protein